MKPIGASPEIDPGAPGLAHRIAAGVTPGSQHVLSFRGVSMPVLTEAELRIVVEVVTELAKYRGTAFDKTSKGTTFARAALIDPAFKARLVQIHRRLEAQRNTDLPRKMLAPLLRELERDAEAVLSGWRPS